MPPLNNITLEQLQQLTSDLREIEDAGRLLHAAGLEPVFDLTPGAPMRITTSAVMPEWQDNGVPIMVSPPLPSPRELMKGHQPQIFMAVTTEPLADRITRRAFERDVGIDAPSEQADETPSFLKHRSTEAPPTSPASEPVDAPLALGEVAEGAPISAEPSRSDEDAGTPKVAAEPEAKAESGGGSHGSDPAPAAPVPGSASALAASAAQFAMWDDAQDAIVIDAIATAQIAGTLKADALRDAAAKLNRTQRAVEQRAYRINAKIKAEVARRAMTQAQTEAPAIPEVTKVDPDQRDAVVGGDTPAAVQSEPQNATVSGAADPITAHLMALSESDGWTLDRDAILMELSIAGWQPNEISLEVGMRADQIKARFDALTGLYLDANRKPVRRFPREDVMAALTRLSAAA